MFHVIFFHPEIPGNTGSAIRLAACTGVRLHLVEPLGFDLSDAKLRRAGLDYHDLALLDRHVSLDAALAATGAGRIFAYTGRGDTTYTEISYVPGDRLLFGPESVGLPADVLDRPDLTARVRVPMIPGRRSLNLSNCAALVVYEAWRQNGFSGA